MPTFFRFNGIKIELYYNDHSPPHFHAIYAEYEDLVEIESLEIYRGDLPRKQRKEVLAWAKQNQPILREIWNKLRAA
ncbi:MAG: DUF4160 domain-containing protein [Bacteroidota bacterium]